MKRIFLSVILAAVGICAWCENSTPRKEPDAVTVQQLADDDFSYLLEGEGVVFTFDGDNVHMTVDGEDESDFTLTETDAITICPAHTFRLKANQDPDNPADCYSTFFTSDGKGATFVWHFFLFESAIKVNKMFTIHCGM